MTINRTFIPAAPPSEHEQGPLSAEHTNLPADASVWAAARRSYVEEGLTCPVVAERHGLHRRTVSRHALAEDWASLRALHLVAARRAEAQARAEAALDDPAAEFVAGLRADEMVDLLLTPTGPVLMRATARLIGEAIAAKRPNEAREWTQVAQGVKAVRDLLDEALRGDDPADRLRTAHFRGLHDHLVAQPLRDDGEEGGAPVPA